MVRVVHVGVGHASDPHAFVPRSRPPRGLSRSVASAHAVPRQSPPTLLRAFGIGFRGVKQCWFFPCCFIVLQSSILCFVLDFGFMIVDGFLRLAALDRGRDRCSCWFALFMVMLADLSIEFLLPRKEANLLVELLFSDQQLRLSTSMES